MNRVFPLHKAGRSIALSWRGLRQRLARVDWRGVAVFGLPFTLYVLTMAPTVYNLDSAELTTAAATGGIIRATGYPLYLLVGRLWSLLPIGDVGYRINLFSAFSGAITIVLADRILRRMGVGLWGAWLALGLLATAPFFWAMSLVAEVYTLHTALMAIAILLLLRWADEPRSHRLAWVGLALGLSAGNHAATTLLVPGCVWYVLSKSPRQALLSRSLLLGTAAVVTGLSVYLYLPLRYGAFPTFNYAGHYDATGTFVPVNLRTPSGLWWLASGQTFAGQMLAYSGPELWHEVWHFIGELWRAFLGVGIGPGLLGAAVSLRRDWRQGGMLLLMFACSAGFYIDYRVVDKDTMFLPAFLIWALWVGVGSHWLLRWVSSESSDRVHRWLVRSVQVSMVGSVLLALMLNWQRVDLSNDRSARAQGNAILRVAEPDALILGWWDTVPIIEYLQLVEGQRLDIDAINRFLISYDDLRSLIRREITGRPVYIDDPPTGLAGIARAERAGPLYRLLPLRSPAPRTTDDRETGAR